MFQASFRLLVLIVLILPSYGNSVEFQDVEFTQQESFFPYEVILSPSIFPHEYKLLIQEILFDNMLARATLTFSQIQKLDTLLLELSKEANSWPDLHFLRAITVLVGQGAAIEVLNKVDCEFISYLSTKGSCIILLLSLGLNYTLLKHCEAESEGALLYDACRQLSQACLFAPLDPIKEAFEQIEACGMVPNYAGIFYSSVDEPLSLPLLHGVVECGYASHVKFLIEHGAWANIADSNGETPLTRAVAREADKNREEKNFYCCDYEAIIDDLVNQEGIQLICRNDCTQDVTSAYFDNRGLCLCS